MEESSSFEYCNEVRAYYKEGKSRLFTGYGSTESEAIHASIVLKDELEESPDVLRAEFIYINARIPLGDG